MTKQKIEVAAQWEFLDQLKEWDENPRHNEEAIDTVAKSIKRFGFGAPIIARKEDGMIIAGHTRYKAAQLLQLDKVPVRYLDLDPADAKMLALADNKVGEISSWNDELLQDIFQDFQENEIDISDLGWSDNEIQHILTGPTIENYIAPENEELDMDDFDNFQHQCPRCNFEWNE
jgi:ParB/RepB/Spo0J family partition protein